MRRLALVLLLAIVCAGLASAVPTVSVCIVDDEGLLPDFDRGIFPTIVLNGELLSHVVEKELSSRTDELGKALHEAWKSEDADRIEKARADYENVSVSISEGDSVNVSFVDTQSADIVVVAGVTQSDVFYTHTLDVTVGGSTKRIYERTSDTKAFDDDSVLALNSVFGYEGYAVKEQKTVEVDFSVAPELSVPKSVQDYSNEKKSFYTWMAVSIATFGARVACRFFESDVLEYVSDGAIAVSLVFTGRSLWKYFKAIQPK